MPLMIIPAFGYSGSGSAASSQELNTLSQKLDALSQRIILVEEALEKYNIPVDTADSSILQMLDEAFSDDFVDDGNNQLDPEYTELLDDIFSGEDNSDPDDITDDDAELFGDFDDIFNP